LDLKYLDFGNMFEERFLKQGYHENRTIDETLSLAWQTLAVLPDSELTKIRTGYIEKYRGGAHRKEGI